MNGSSVKNWFARHGFKPVGWRSNPRNWFSVSHGRTCQKFGRVFRIRQEAGAWVVDISEPRAQFDRWANSRESTVELESFVRCVQAGKFKEMLE